MVMLKFGYFKVWRAGNKDERGSGIFRSDLQRFENRLTLVEKISTHEVIATRRLQES